MFEAGVRVLPGASIKACVDDRLHRLSLCKVTHDHRRPITHFLRPLADEDIDLVVLEGLQFRSERIGRDDDELAALDLIPFLIQ